MKSAFSSSAVSEEVHANLFRGKSEERKKTHRDRHRVSMQQTRHFTGGLSCEDGRGEEKVEVVRTKSEIIGSDRERRGEKKRGEDGQEKVKNREGVRGRGKENEWR